MGNNDAGIFDLTIVSPTYGTVTVAEFTGGDIDPDQEVSFNEGPAGVKFGFNFQSEANGANATLTVRQTSEHLGILQDIVRRQEVTQVIVEARKKDIYADNQIVGFMSPQAVLTADAMSLGKGDAEDVTFNALCIGWAYIRHNADPIAQPPVTP